MKHYESVLLPNFRVSNPPHKRKDHYWRLSGKDSASKSKRSKFLNKIQPPTWSKKGWVLW